MDQPKNGTVDDAVVYAQRINLQKLLAEYLQRVLTDRPKDPVQYLIDQIKERPVLPPTYPEDNAFYRNPKTDSKYIKEEIKKQGARAYEHCRSE